MKVEYINHSLTDHDVANIARQSFLKLADDYTEAQNHSLIKYLARGVQSADWENKMIEMANTTDLTKIRQMAVELRSIPEHWVPFGHPTITLRMQAPVPIRTQCYKHKIGFVESEESRRYVKTTPEIYIPESFRMAAADVKQGSAGVHPNNDDIMEAYKVLTAGTVVLYNRLIADGVCPEQARFMLPQGTEINWVWTGSLYAFAKAYVARSGDHAQKEVRDLFKMVGDVIEPLYPVSWPALTRGGY